MAIVSWVWDCNDECWGCGCGCSSIAVVVVVVAERRRAKVGTAAAAVLAMVDRRRCRRRLILCVEEAIDSFMEYTIIFFYRDDSVIPKWQLLWYR